MGNLPQMIARLPGASRMRILTAAIFEPAESRHLQLLCAAPCFSLVPDDAATFVMIAF
jgi:hypothetical protein